MSELKETQCEACRSDAPTATPEEKKTLHEEIPQWQIVEVGGVEQLHRRFSFKNFQQALDFTNQVGELAEREQHHPAITTEYGAVTVAWWTHKIGGLHKNDFIMAAKTDSIGAG